jgi:hypothetical protein
MYKIIKYEMAGKTDRREHDVFYGLVSLNVAMNYGRRHANVFWPTVKTVIYV